MATQSAQSETAISKRLTTRTIMLIAATIAITVFAVMNMNPVYVWPLGRDKPLIVVIIISFVLGGLIGWLSRSITSRRTLARD